MVRLGKTFHSDITGWFHVFLIFMLQALINHQVRYCTLIPSSFYQPAVFFPSVAQYYRLLHVRNLYGTRGPISNVQLMNGITWFFRIIVSAELVIFICQASSDTEEVSIKRNRNSTFNWIISSISANLASRDVFQNTDATCLAFLF